MSTAEVIAAWIQIVIGFLISPALVAWVFYWYWNDGKDKK